MTTLLLTGAQWRALETHRATERTRYAMEYVGYFPATDKSRALLAGDGVVCATDGKRAIFLPATVAPTSVTLTEIPKVSKAKRALGDAYPGAGLPDGTEGRHFPPALDVLPSAPTSDGLEIPTDDLRALFSPFATDANNDTVRCWFGLGIHLRQSVPLTDVSLQATWRAGTATDCDPIGLGASYVLSVCDAADVLGVTLVTIRASKPRDAVTFALAGKALALVMPRVLS